MDNKRIDLLDNEKFDLLKEALKITFRELIKLAEGISGYSTRFQDSVNSLLENYKSLLQFIDTQDCNNPKIIQDEIVSTIAVKMDNVKFLENGKKPLSADQVKDEDTMLSAAADKIKETISKYNSCQYTEFDNKTKAFYGLIGDKLSHLYLSFEKELSNPKHNN